MEPLMKYLYRQTTDVLTAALNQPTSDNERTRILKNILLNRELQLNKYNPAALLKMTPLDLIRLLNSPEIRSDDLYASKIIMLDILNILEDTVYNDEIYFSKELIDYLRENS